MQCSMPKSGCPESLRGAATRSDVLFSCVFSPTFLLRNRLQSPRLMASTVRRSPDPAAILHENTRWFQVTRCLSNTGSRVRPIHAIPHCLRWPNQHRRRWLSKMSRTLPDSQISSSETWGAAWGDVNGDSYPDIFFSNHRTRATLVSQQPRRHIYRGFRASRPVRRPRVGRAAAPTSTRTASRGVTSTMTATRTFTRRSKAAATCCTPTPRPAHQSHGRITA